MDNPNNRLRKLPVGIQTFREIIEGGYVYADKTEYIYDLINGGKYYFLSRPRRFGKSLLVDTIREVFLGSRELFEGLRIGGSDYDFKPRPVIRLDMTQMSLGSTHELDRSLFTYLSGMAESEGLSLSGEDTPVLFAQLISALHDKYGERVAVLIDEYDKPVIDFMDKPDRAASNRELLGNFYGVLKGQDAHLAFVFLTGVTKFTKLSLFSKLNNLSDITLRGGHAGICGFTEAEFDAMFSDRLAAGSVSRKDIFDWYDGYTWDGETRVFNPFSLLSFFRDQEIYPYWYTTGVPTFLMKDFRNRPEEYALVQETTIEEALLDSHEIENAPLVSLLFQTGFLTVKSVVPSIPKGYVLGFPNIEVSQTFARQFLSTVAEVPDISSLSYIREIRSALDAGEPERLEAPLSGMYAALPYHLHVASEAYYHSIFLAVMQSLGFRISGETATSEGRADVSVDWPGDKSYVIEFKYVKGANDAIDSNSDNEAGDEAELERAIAEALVQIDTKGYADRYKGTRRDVYKVAVVVAGRGRVKVATG